VSPPSSCSSFPPSRRCLPLRCFPPYLLAPPACHPTPPPPRLTCPPRACLAPPPPRHLALPPSRRLTLPPSRRLARKGRKRAEPDGSALIEPDCCCRRVVIFLLLFVWAFPLVIVVWALLLVSALVVVSLILLLLSPFLPFVASRSPLLRSPFASSLPCFVSPLLCLSLRLDIHRHRLGPLPFLHLGPPPPFLGPRRLGPPPALPLVPPPCCRLPSPFFLFVSWPLVVGWDSRVGPSSLGGFDGVGLDSPAFVVIRGFRRRSGLSSSFGEFVVACLS